MKKAVLIFFALILTQFVFRNNINAAANPWTITKGCDKGDYLLSDAGQYIPVRYTNNFLATANNKDLCVVNGSIGAIEEDQPMTLAICPKGYTLPKDPNNPSNYKVSGGLDPIVGYGCCPSNYPFLFADAPLFGTKYEYCANVTSLANPETLNCVDDAAKGLACLKQCSGSGSRCAVLDGEEGTAGNYFLLTSPEYSSNPNADGYLYPGTDQNMCASPNCIMSSAKLYDETNRGPYSLADIASQALVCSLDGAAFSDHTCVQGNWYLTSDYEKWKDNLGALLTCGAFPSPEKETCTACYEGCPTCSYSSLGCIQTTQNGMIVRIFQIGLGVVGALAIARFIQAALLRQTADPSKIQESYDIITSIIIGIVVLLGSTVILRFVGVDILQMLPF